MGCGASTANNAPVDEKAVVPAENHPEAKPAADAPAADADKSASAPADKLASAPEAAVSAPEGNPDAAAVTSDEAAAAAAATSELPDVVLNLRAVIIEALKEVKPQETAANLKSPAEQVMVVAASTEPFTAETIEDAAAEVLLRLLSIKDAALKQFAAAVVKAVQEHGIDVQAAAAEVAKIDFSKRS
jgi:hypothetical protein